MLLLKKIAYKMNNLRQVVIPTQSGYNPGDEFYLYRLENGDILCKTKENYEKENKKDKS